MTSDSHALIGPYLLHALDRHESRLFDKHLRACPDCERDVHELRTVTVRLATAVRATPPRGLRDRTLAEIAHTRQARRYRRRPGRSGKA